VTREQEARMELVASARANHERRSFREWQDCIAPQWALDALTQREVDALFGLFWEPRRKGSRVFSRMGRS
jgi:hypothetical protein